MDATNAETEAIVSLEADVIRLTADLNELAHVPRDPSVPRDYLGTLHVNLCVLKRAAERLAKLLAERHGF